MKNPEWFEMGPTRWLIIWDKALINKYHIDNDQAVFGYCDKEKAQVIINPELTLHRRQETLIHEMGHAAFDYITTSREKPTEEDYVSNGMPLLLQALRSNKQLRKFLFNDDAQ